MVLSGYEHPLSEQTLAEQAAKENFTLREYSGILARPGNQIAAENAGSELADGGLFEYGLGAKVPPLRINADGTYVWYDEFNQPPVKGRWTPEAKIEGAKFWTNFANGVVIKDSKGGEWKVYRWKLEGDNEDRITVKTLCAGSALDGTRIR